MPGPNETKVFYCSGPDRRLWRGKVQLALPVHKERVQFGVKIDHWSRVCHQIHPGIRDVLKLVLHVEKLSESTNSCRLTGRQLRPRSGTQLARSVIEPSLRRKLPPFRSPPILRYWRPPFFRVGTTEAQWVRCWCTTSQSTSPTRTSSAGWGSWGTTQTPTSS